MSRDTRIRFGVQTWPQNVAWADLKAAWKFIEAAGFDTAWTFDHFCPIMADPSGDCLEGWVSLAALARETSRVRIGTLVTGNTYRHPAILAKMGATLDHLSEGRFVMGMGAGWFELEHDAYGIRYPPVGERIARLDEACEIVRMLWSRGLSNFRGRYYALRDARCAPKPVQSPAPPLLVGGGGEKKTLAVVARHADEWNWFGSVPTFRHKLEVLRAHCAKEGRDASEIGVSWAGRLAIVEGAGKRDAIRRGAQRWGQTPEEFEANHLVGSLDEIEGRIREYVAAGVTHFIVSADAPYELEGLRRFAERIIPRFR